MIAMKLGWLLLEALFGCFFLYFGSSAALALAIVLLLIPLVSIPVNLILRKSLTPSLEASGSLRKGEDGSFTVKLRNPSLLPALRITCEVRVLNQLNRDSITQRLYTHVFPLRERQSELRIASRYCGRLRISVGKLKLYDCFGLVGIPCRA